MTEPVESANGGAQSGEHGFENQRRLWILAAVVCEPSWSRADLEVNSRTQADSAASIL